MGPRKKTKANGHASVEEPGNSVASSQSDITSQNANSKAPTPADTQVLPPNTPPPPAPPTRSDTGNESISSASKLQSSASVKRSWYGSWKSKASPIAQVVKESIGVTGGSTTELASESSTQLDSSSPRKLLYKRRPSKGTPLAASMTKLTVTSSNNESGTKLSEETTDAQRETPVDPPLPPDPTKTQADLARKDDLEKDAQAVVAEQTPSVTSWRYWWSRPDGYTANTAKTSKEQEISGSVSKEAQETPLPEPTPSEEPTKTLATEPTPNSNNADDKQPSATSATDGNTQSKSWFWLWSSAQNAQAQTPPAEDHQDSQETEQTDIQPQPNDCANAENTTNQAPQPTDSKCDSHNIDKPKSSGWAFWSTSKPKQPNDIAPSGSTHKEVGELAVADTPSQSRPEAAQFNEQEEHASQGSPSKDIRKSPQSRRGKDPPSKLETHSKSAAEKIATKQSEPSSNPQLPPNLLLPDFRSTYNLVQTPSFWKQLRRYFLGGEAEAPHLYIEPAPPRIKKAIAIGVHGYFPAPLIQRVIGQPTGTSIRFANAAAAAIDEWTEAHGYSCEIEKVALEGEGFIADRVTTLWKLLLNWIDHIKQADFILVACHSQGVPVAIQLVAKLVQFGCINSPKIGICAMAGVNLGPFAEYKPRFFAGSASELFDFGRPQSAVSTNYMNALEEVLKYGAKLVYIGSIDDQLVSLESSIFSSISHPYIYRAVFVDGRIHAPDFITHLVGFALKLRNLGLPDHGLIRELSPALAGSLYTGEGHSRIYEDPAVYRLAVSHALETTTLSQEAPLVVKDHEGGIVANSNPYFLPWAMRGLLEEDFVRREMKQEVEDLLASFESWKPVSKGLKDVRFRLEAVKTQKSKL